MKKWHLDRIISIATLLTSVIALYLVLKKPAPVAFNKEEFKNDPLIKKALEVFKGTIVEVRS